MKEWVQEIKNKKVTSINQKKHEMQLLFVYLGQILNFRLCCSTSIYHYKPYSQSILESSTYMGILSIG